MGTGGAILSPGTPPLVWFIELPTLLMMRTGGCDTEVQDPGQRGRAGRRGRGASTFPPEGLAVIAAAGPASFSLRYRPLSVAPRGADARPLYPRGPGHRPVAFGHTRAGLIGLFVGRWMFACNTPMILRRRGADDGHRRTRLAFPRRHSSRTIGGTSFFCFVFIPCISRGRVHLALAGAQTSGMSPSPPRPMRRTGTVARPSADMVRLQSSNNRGAGRWTIQT